MTRKIKSNTYENGDYAVIGGNSLTFAYREMVNTTGWFAIKAVAGGVISGVSKSVLTTASDNQTVAKAKVIVEGINASTTYRMPITGGTITVADEGKYYDLSTSILVDGATENATTGQLKLVKFISATLCDFVIVNL